jgi:hypothetical protein
MRRTIWPVRRRPVWAKPTIVEVLRRTIPPKTKQQQSAEAEALAKKLGDKYDDMRFQLAEAESLAQLGRRYDELRMDYFYGKLGYQESWATFCRKELGRTKVEVDRMIEISRAEDPLAKLREQRRLTHRRLAEGVERKEEGRRRWLNQLLERQREER